MKFPWQSKMETRADSSYTDAFLTALLSRATGQSTAFPAAVGALEAASGLTARAFATAMVQTASNPDSERVDAILSCADREDIGQKRRDCFLHRHQPGHD